MLEPATLPPECAAALEMYRAARGVVDFAVFVASDNPEGEVLHRQATIQAHGIFGGEMRSEPLALARISTAQFLGTLSTSEGIFDQPGAFLEARAHALATKGSFSTSPGEGFLYAFCDPPYGITLTPPEAQRVFDAICARLFRDFRDDLEILRWSNDWSTYFDAGHEWWGAFWWTVYDHTRKTVIVIAASSTD